MSTLNETSEKVNMYSKVPQNEEIYEDNRINSNQNQKKLSIDTIKQRYPYCIVWTPIPCITWLFPSIGHAGICDSEGIIYDFASPYFVSVDNMAFGNPTKAALLELTQKEFAEYDRAVQYGRKCYNKLSYDLFTNNCHSFIAKVLNKLKYKGKSDYNMVDVWWILTTKSRYLSWMDLLKTYLGFIIIFLFSFFLFYSFSRTLIK